MIGESLQLFLFFGLIGALTNWLAWKKGFYRFAPGPSLNLSWWYVIGVFAIYLGMMLVVAQNLVNTLIFLSSPSPPPLALLNAIQLFILIGTVVFLYLFSLSQGRGLFSNIIKNSKSRVAWDIGLGFLAWFISFPIVAIVGQFFDLLLYLF